MNDHFDKLFKALKQVRLEDAERDVLRQKLLTYIEDHSVRVAVEERQIEQRSSTHLFLTFLTKPMPIILAIIIFLGGGMSVAAERALPGDILYPVKIGINERFQSVLALSADAQAKLELRLAERRLEDAEGLSVRAHLASETRAQLQENFDRHAEKVEARIAELENHGQAEEAADLSSNFEVSLKAHEKILARLEEDQPDDQSELEVLHRKVSASEQGASSLKSENEAKVTGQPNVQSAAEGKMNAAQNKIDEVGAYLDRIKARPTAQATAEAEAKLAEAQKTFYEGKARLEAKAFGDAFTLFRSAAEQAQEAKLLVRAGLNLNLQLNLDDERKDGEDSSGSSGTTTRAEGVLQGQVTIGPLCPVEIAGVPCEAQPGYSTYSVIVAENNRDKVIARTKLDEQGKYKLELPAGIYSVRIEPAVGIYKAQNKQQVTISANITTELNFDLDTGIR